MKTKKRLVWVAWWFTQLIRLDGTIGQFISRWQPWKAKKDGL